MSILQMCLLNSTPPSALSSSRVLSTPNHLFFLSKPSIQTITTPKTTSIRMGGGPRTFPGGVSKWQWKRMQAKKAKQLLQARLARERQIYEMRKRAELKAAVSELERPWEVVEARAPKLFSVKADEQVKVLADRFQRPGGFDLWSERDGPQLLSLVDGVPSARFFPKGVVHSIKPYGVIEKGSDSDSEPELGMERNRYVNSGRFGDGSGSDGLVEAKNSVESSMDRNGKGSNGKFRKKGKRRNSSNLNGLVSGRVGVDREQRKEAPVRRTGDNGRNRGIGSQKLRVRGSGSQKLRGSDSEVCDMSRLHDGSYGFQTEN
ncbi:unnamed protein product [Camellia sinensis]